MFREEREIKKSQYKKRQRFIYSLFRLKILSYNWISRSPSRRDLEYIDCILYRGVRHPTQKNGYPGCDTKLHLVRRLQFLSVKYPLSLLPDPHWPAVVITISALFIKPILTFLHWIQSAYARPRRNNDFFFSFSFLESFKNLKIYTFNSYSICPWTKKIKWIKIIRNNYHFESNLLNFFFSFRNSKCKRHTNPTSNQTVLKIIRMK